MVFGLDARLSTIIFSGGAVREHTPELSSQTDRKIDISVSEPFQECLSEKWLREVAGHALEVSLLPGEPGQVSLLVTGDDTVRELNREFRGLDEVTDVLSFSAVHPGQWEGDTEPPDDRLLKPGDFAVPDFVLPPDEAPPLGEVIISYPQALRQARQQEEPVDQELALLIVHGILHLVGYDHLEPDEESLMKAREHEALSALFHSGTDIR